MEKIKSDIKVFINFLLDTIFPSRCLGCNKRNEIICDLCLLRVKQCNQTEHENVFALYDYKSPLIKKAIWKLKYYHTPYLGKKFGELLYESFIEEINNLRNFSLGSPIYVIPVPTSKIRKQKRGYNQTEIIAKSFCQKNYFLKFKNKIIYKNRETIPQARLTNRNKRLKNLIGAFSLKNENEIKSKTIIIIDDVTTTGSTMMEIMKILNKSGARRVIGLAVAH